MSKPFNCNAGDKLSQIGASYLVCYLYSINIDNNEIRYKKRKLNKINLIKQNKQNIVDWLKFLRNSKPSNLNKNKMGIKGNEVINMINVLLKLNNINV